MYLALKRSSVSLASKQNWIFNNAMPGTFVDEIPFVKYGDMKCENSDSKHTYASSAGVSVQLSYTVQISSNKNIKSTRLLKCFFKFKHDGTKWSIYTIYVY